MNTVLYCQHYAQTVAFYEHVLGLQRTLVKDWFVEFRVAQQAFLSIADQNHATINSAQGKGLTLTFQVEDVHPGPLSDVVHSGGVVPLCDENLAGGHEQLRARGATLTAVGARPWGAQGFLLRDPEGTRIEIWAPSLATSEC